MALTLGFGTNSVQAEDNFASAEIISSLPSGENTDVSKLVYSTDVSEGLDTISLGGEQNLLTSEGEFTNSREGYLSLRVNPSPENLTFANAQVDFQPSPVGRGGVPTGFAAEITPTLDDMNTKANSFTPTGKYDLTTTQGTNTHFLVLDNGSGTLTKYWYTPNEGSTEKNNILNYLTGTSLTTTGANADNYVFKNGTTYYIFDMTKPRPTSVYTLTAGTSSNYDIKTTDGTNSNYYNFDLNNNKITANKLAQVSAGASDNYDFQALKATSDGTIHADKYYNITIDPTKASHVGSELSNISWSTEAPSGYTWAGDYVAGSNITVSGDTVTGAIRMKSQHNGILPSIDSWNKWFIYTYTKPSTYSFIKDNTYTVSTSEAGNSYAYTYNVPTEGRSGNVITNDVGATIATGSASITNKTYANNVLNGTYLIITTS